MRAFILILGFTLLVGCNSQEEKPRNNTTPEADVLDSSNVNSVNPFTNTGNGPSGSTDPVLPPADPAPVGPFPTPPAPPVQPTAIQYCGTLYKDFVDQKDYFLQTGDVTPFYIKGVFPASSVIVQNIYPNDSKDVCLMGYEDANTPVTNGLTTLIAESIDVLGTIDNPNRPNQALFSNEVCGVVSQFNSVSGASYLQIVENGLVAYIINNEALMLPIPATTSTSDPAFTLRGCVYSNTAPYNDLSITFKKFIDIEGIYFNPMPIIIVN